MSKHQDIFNTQFLDNVQYNNFQMDPVHKTTMRFGYIYPVFNEEVLPGDNWTIQTMKMFKTLSPLIVPMTSRVRIYEHWYFVPNRLVWKDWEKFISDSSSELQVPQVIWPQSERIVESRWSFEQTLGGYLGLPLVLPDEELLVDIMPLGGVSLIWNEYYREQSVMGEIEFEFDQGLNVFGTNFTFSYENQPPQKCWRKDYFTAALPAAQKGNPILMPLTTSDKVNVEWGNNINRAGIIRNATGGAIYSGSAVDLATSNTGILQTSGGAVQTVYDPNGSLYVDVNNEAVTIDTFRTALALQAFLVKDNIGGGRYTEVIKSHFNAMPPDFRLQRPEYLGGSVQYLSISEVLSTAETDSEGDTIPIGQFGGQGNSKAQGDYINYYATEHGHIFCMVSMEPDLEYFTRGIHRKWTRILREDYAWPTFAHLGEQPILNQELHAKHNDPQVTFGYIPRYSEYKYLTSKVSGELTQTLGAWHMGIDVPDNVALNSQFLLVDDLRWNLTRIFAVNPNGDPEKPLFCNDYMLAVCYFDVNLRRALPRYAVPKLVG